MQAYEHGSFQCFGNNFNGQCSVPADLGPVVQVAAGVDRICAVLADGRLQCFGYNFDGLELVPVPVDLGPCVKLAAGVSHILCSVPVSADLGPVVRVSAITSNV